MSDEQLIMTLAKVLVAAAWADGELTHEEENSMKDLLWRLPELPARQWASIQMYLEAPVGEAERVRLVEDLRAAIASPEDRSLALSTLDEIMHVDGEVTEEEERVAAEIKAAIESVDVGLLGQLVKGMTGRATPRIKPGVCFPWEQRVKDLPEITGDPAMVQRIWEDIDALGNTYIWQLLLSF